MTDTEKNTTESSDAPKRKKHVDKGQLFKPGKSGNPMGRPKGSKNKLTLLREAVREGAEEMVLAEFEKVVQATLELAKEGDPTALRIVWDQIMPKKAVDDAKKDDKLNITINVGAMEVDVTTEDVPEIETSVVEGEFTEITE